MATITMGDKTRDLMSGANKKTYTVGRHGDFDMPQGYGWNAISRLHFAIYNDHGNYSVQDLNSSGGTVVDGLFIGLERTPLRDGSTIEFGQRGTRWETGLKVIFNHGMSPMR